MELESPDFDISDDQKQAIIVYNKFPLLQIIENEIAQPFNEVQSNNCYDTYPYSPKVDESKIPKKCQNAIKKLRKKDKLRRAVVKKDSIYQNSSLNPCNTMKLFAGISITSDGVIRFCYSLSQISFGFQQQQITLIQHKNDQEFVNVHLNVDEALPNITLKEGLKFLVQFSNPSYPLIADRLEYYNNVVSSIKSQINSFHLSQDFIKKKDEEFNEFIDLAYDYLAKYVQENPDQMFQYTLGRINLVYGDVEVVRAGYSKAYLQLLGISPEQFTTFFLRQQKIDLMREKQDVQKQSIEGLKIMNIHNKQKTKEVYISQILTFDGYPIKLRQEKKNIHIPLKNEYRKSFNLNYPYILCITQMDVDVSDLQNLINYRKRISLNPKYLTLDEFLNKELSYQFENVEYSVHSQSFLEKYYSENLTGLKNQEELLNNKKYAGYKAIHQNGSNV